MHVELNNIHFSYDHKHPILSGLSLGMKQGELVALLGPSGSGKSTLLRLISGLELPSKGTITVNGVILSSDTTFIKPEHRHIGMVFQNYALFPHMTVRQNIVYGLSKQPKAIQEQILADMLTLTNLTGKDQKYPHELSGGEQQRVALARSLALQPDLLLLDEPFSNIDSELKSNIRQDIKRILQQANITCLFVTHDEGDANDMADRIVRINQL